MCLGTKVRELVSETLDGTENISMELLKNSLLRNKSLPLPFGILTASKQGARKSKHHSTSKSIQRYVCIFFCFHYFKKRRVEKRIPASAEKHEHIQSDGKKNY